jgi:hypothetical protein
LVVLRTGEAVGKYEVIGWYAHVLHELAGGTVAKDPAQVGAYMLGGAFRL